MACNKRRKERCTLPYSLSTKQSTLCGFQSVITFLVRTIVETIFFMLHTIDNPTISRTDSLNNVCKSSFHSSEVCSEIVFVNLRNTINQ